MPGSQPYGFDHRFAIEDLLDQYLEAFQPGNRPTVASERQEAGIEAAAVMTAGQHDDEFRAASARGRRRDRARLTSRARPANPPRYFRL
jgi:hypothetical protein